MRRNPFHYREERAGPDLRVYFSGALDEAAELPDVKAEGGGKLILNLKGIVGLNSNGTRTWCLWLHRFKHPTQVILEDCPVLMVKSFSMVKGFLISNSQVVSFFVPFYSEASGERKDFLAVLGQHYFADGRVELPVVKDSKGAAMEMDVIASTYFAFLKK